MCFSLACTSIICLSSLKSLKYNIKLSYTFDYYMSWVQDCSISNFTFTKTFCNITIILFSFCKWINWAVEIKCTVAPKPVLSRAVVYKLYDLAFIYMHNQCILLQRIEADSSHCAQTHTWCFPALDTTFTQTKMEKVCTEVIQWCSAKQTFGIMMNLRTEVERVEFS